MRRPLCGFGARLVRSFYRALIAAGRIWVHIPDCPPPPPHPCELERLRPDIPLSAVEIALDRQLSDLER
ncbi:DUF6059 family protein [Streptomyces sp. NBC_00338]|nr:DUF6059 family protein [Streptomyces sp. NBC_00338]MCX5141944.1 hypothetical protein [Streptomyces sp. NBC_00338]